MAHTMLNPVSVNHLYPASTPGRGHGGPSPSTSPRPEVNMLHVGSHGHLKVKSLHSRAPLPSRPQKSGRVVFWTWKKPRVSQGGRRSGARFMKKVVMKKEYGAFGGATLEKSKLNLSAPSVKVSPQLEDGVGSGGIGNKNNHGGGDGGDDDGDDDDYFGEKCSPTRPRLWGIGKMVTSLAVACTCLQGIMPVSSENFPTGWSIPQAQAVLFSPDTKVPRSAEVALRRAIPTVNVSVKKMQESLEEIFYLLRIPQRKPFGTMESNVKRALQLAKDDKEAIINVLSNEKKELGLDMLNEVISGKYGMERLLDAIGEKDADKISIRLSNALEKLADLEILEAPGLAFLLPSQYQEYPRLTGRATVEFVFEKGDGSPFTVAAGGGPKKIASLEVVLDGYSAPLTSGNFAVLVMQGKYNNLKLRTGEASVLSDSQDGEVGTPIPLEILPAGDFQPLYRTTLDVQDGEIPVLPLSVYGAVAMAHNEVAEDFSSPNQFFFYLYDKRNAGLGGLAFDEGQFSVFGYVTRGRELLSQLKTGDIIQSATMISGQDRLIFPIAVSST